jgi:DivIVA domain-containing protein
MQYEPHEIESKTFRRRWRGFDPPEVRAFLVDVAATVRDDDDFRRAGIEVATALRRMHELLTEMKDAAALEATSVRRQALVDAEELLSEAHRAAEQMRVASEEAVGRARFEAAAWATRVRGEAELDRRAADERVEEANRELARLEEEMARRAEEAVEEELERRQLEVERVDRRVNDLQSTEIGVVARLRKIGREIAELVEVPLDGEIDVPARRDSGAADGVVLDLTGTDRVEGALQSGLRRGLVRRDD